MTEDYQADKDFVLSVHPTAVASYATDTDWCIDTQNAVLNYSNKTQSLAWRFAAFCIINKCDPMDYNSQVKFKLGQN